MSPPRQYYKRRPSYQPCADALYFDYNAVASSPCAPMLFKALTLRTSYKLSGEREFGFFFVDSSAWTLPPALALYATAPATPTGPTPISLTLGVFLRHGRLAPLYGQLTLAWLETLRHLTAPENFLASQEWAEGLSPTRTEAPQGGRLHGCLDLVFAGLEVAYRVRYSQLNRKLRKIVKNKYRYQKRHEWIPPRARPYFVASLLKKYTITRNEFFFTQRIAGGLTEYLLLPESSPLRILALANQTTAVSALSQTAVKR